MSAPSHGDKPAYIEYTAPTRKNVRRAPKPLRDIGVEQFVRPGGTLIGAGHVLLGSAFDTLARKKKPLQKQGGKRVKMSQYEVGEKTGNGGKTDLKGKTGVDDKTNNPAVAPGARGDTPRQGFNATDWDESLWGEHDESIDGIKPQEARQKRNNRVLKDLRPNVAIPAPAARTLKAKAGAWGASKLMKPKQDVENTVAHPTANKADPDALEAFEEKRKRQALAAKNKPTAEESYSNGHFAKRNEKAIVQVHKGKADVEYPSSLCGQPPQRKQRKRKASPTAPFFSEDEEDEDDEDDIPVVPKIRPGRAKPASRIQTHDTRNKKATSAIPAKTVVEQLSQDDEEEDDDADDDNDDDEDDDDDDEDDMPVVLNNRRRRTERASQSQAHDSQNEEAVGNQRPQDDEDEDNDDDDDDDVDDGTPIVQINRRRRAQPAQPSQPNDIPNQPTARPLSDNAAINLLMQLGAPPTQAQVLAHIPLAQFSTTIPASQPRPQPRRQPQPERQTQRQPQPERQTQRQPQPERQPQPQVQTLPKKGVAHPPQPKRARPTTATTNKKDTTPSPPSKKPRVARKTEPQKPVTKREPANPTAKEEEPAKAAEKPAAPAKKGVAAIKGKKGVAVKKPIPKKGRNKNKGYAFVTDESGSD